MGDRAQNCYRHSKEGRGAFSPYIACVFHEFKVIAMLDMSNARLEEQRKALN